MLFGSSENFEHKCEFGEQAVVYLYGELDDSDSAKFNAHLENCEICADEIKAFSAIHFSIRDWKAAEFDALAKPEIRIPFDVGQKSGLIPESKNWLTNLRELFSTSRIFVPLGAFAALLICIGVSFYIFSSDAQTEFAANVDTDGSEKVFAPIEFEK